jgi:predicted dehydrogenase
MPNAAISIGVVGAGAIGRAHVERILRTPGAVLAGVAEPGEAGRQWCEQRGVAWFPEHGALLEATRPQGMVVATPNATHVAIAEECMAFGTPVLVEKPLADRLDDAARLVHLERSSGVPVLVGHHRRHNPVLQRAREWIAEGRLGQVVNAVALACVFKPASYFELAWRREAGGGPVLINLIHDVDMLLYLLGPARAAQAAAANQVRGFAVEDTAATLLEFQGGTLATLSVSDTAASPWNWDLCAGEQPQYPRQPVQSHFFMGTQGSLSLPDLSLWRYPGQPHWHQELLREQRVVHHRDPYDAQLEHFLAVITSREAPLCSALDGWKTLEATLAILEAARTGARVECRGSPDPSDQPAQETR